MSKYWTLVFMLLHLDIFLKLIFTFYVVYIFFWEFIFHPYLINIFKSNIFIQHEFQHTMKILLHMDVGGEHCRLVQGSFLLWLMKSFAMGVTNSTLSISTVSPNNMKMK